MIKSLLLRARPSLPVAVTYLIHVKGTKRERKETVPLEFWLHLWGNAKGVISLTEHRKSDVSNFQNMQS
jgi:hypothetical protein